MPITGSQELLGNTSLQAVSNAVGDFNYSVLKESYAILVSYEDTQTNPATALQKLQKLESQGIKIFIGPFTNEEMAICKPYADAHNLILISPFCLSPNFALANDNLFRLSLDDSYQAAAVAKLASNDGVEIMIPLYPANNRDSTLINLVTSGFSGQMEGGISYAPSSTKTDFSAELTLLRTKVNGQTRDANKIGVYVLAGSESVELMKQVVKDALLSNVRWYGNSDIPNNPAWSLQTDSLFRRGLTKLYFYSPLIGFDTSASLNKITTKITSNSSFTPDPYCFIAYDAVYLLATAIRANSWQTDPTVFKTQFIKLASAYTGITGKLELNDKADRKNGYIYLYKPPVSGSWIPLKRYITSTGIIQNM